MMKKNMNNLLENYAIKDIEHIWNGIDIAVSEEDIRS